MHDSFDDLRLPPAQGVGICPICRGLNYTEETLCAECTHISESLQQSIDGRYLEQPSQPPRVRPFAAFEHDLGRAMT